MPHNIQGMKRQERQRQVQGECKHRCSMNRRQEFVSIPQSPAPHESKLRRQISQDRITVMNEIKTRRN